MMQPGVLDIPSMKTQCSEAEWQACFDLAACYGLVDHYGLSDMIANHILSHVPGEPCAFLINPTGGCTPRITASSLLKVDQDRTVLSTPSFGAIGRRRQGRLRNPQRGARGAARRRLRDPHPQLGHDGLLVARDCSLLPLTQMAMGFLKIGYHGYQGVVPNDEQKESLLADLGKSEAVILRNHVALVVGRSVGKAFNWMRRLELAFRSQIGAMSCNSPLRRVPGHVLEETWNNYQPGTRRPFGLREWPTLLRKLDGWTRVTATDALWRSRPEELA